jgi:hypothetical protein
MSARWRPLSQSALALFLRLALTLLALLAALVLLLAAPLRLLVLLRVLAGLGGALVLTALALLLLAILWIANLLRHAFISTRCAPAGCRSCKWMRQAECPAAGGEIGMKSRIEP